MSTASKKDRPRKKYVYMLDSGAMYTVEAPSEFLQGVGATMRVAGKEYQRVIAVLDEDAYKKLTGKRL